MESPHEHPSPAPSSAALITQTQAFVQKYMSQPQYDASHDYAHIQRVLALAHHILSVEQATHPTISYDPTLVTLAALTHDIGDSKYTTPTSPSPTTAAQEALIGLGAPLALARSVQTIVNAVSYRHERAHPGVVRAVLAQHPELGIVQDADRLDAIGAVGIGRAFTYGGAKGRGEAGMEGTVGHFGEKLERLEGLMKTGEGRRVAAERTERLRVFRRWWAEETAVGVGKGGEEH